MADFNVKTQDNVGAPTPNSGDGTHPSDVARGSGQSDPFPPEGTDEKSISPIHSGDDPISQAESLKATQAALAYGAGHTKSAGLMDIVTTFMTSFMTGFFRTTPTRTCLRADKKMRDDLDEGQIDAMVDDSFPASDPPSSY